MGRQQARIRSFLEEHGLTLTGMEVLTPALSMPQAEAAVQASLPPSLALPLPKALAQALTQSQPPSGEPAVKGTSAELAKQTQHSSNKLQGSDTASNKVSLKQSKLNFKKLAKWCRTEHTEWLYLPGDVQVTRSGCILQIRNVGPHATIRPQN